MTDYHWSPANQRAFLEHLSTTGNITAAAKSVGMSKQSAHALCGRGKGAAFRLGWDAAVLMARRRMESELLERALEGQEETYERDADSGRVTRTRVHNGLSMAMLARLDRMALGRNDVPAETAMARIVSQDFDAYLDLIEAGGEGGAAMLFVAARDGGLYSLAGKTIDVSEDDSENFAMHGQLAQIPEGSAEDEETEPEPELSPEESAAEMSVWYCDHASGWRTDFPPPPDFYGEEDGEFGDEGYERELSEEEAECRSAQAEAEIAPLIEAGEAARRAWFGLDGEKEDFTQRRRAAREAGSHLPAIVEPATAEIGTMDYSAVPQGDDGACLAEPASLRLCASAPTESEPESASTAVECESVNPAVRPPPQDPNIRVIPSKPLRYYPGSGRIPPWAERIC